MKKEWSVETMRINKALEKAILAVKNVMMVCGKNGAPLRSITFHVLDDGGTKFHVTYRRIKK